MSTQALIAFHMSLLCINLFAMSISTSTAMLVVNSAAAVFNTVAILYHCINL